MKFKSRECRTILPLLWNYADAALSQTRQKWVDAHLKTCGRCAAQAEAYRQTAALMRQSRDLPLADPTDWRSLCARLENETALDSIGARQHSRRPLLAWGGAFAAMALVTAGMTRPGSDEKAPPLRVPRSPFRSRTPTVTTAMAALSQKVPSRNKGPLAQRLARAAKENVLPSIPNPSADPPAPAAVSTQSDLAYLNSGGGSLQNGARPTVGADAAMQAEIDRVLRAGDDFVAVAFPQIASKDKEGIKAAAQAYRQEKEIIDSRLARKITVAAKGMAFVDFCRQLRSLTGIEITAGRSIANQKITVFCKAQPLRDLMRQMRQVFGFTWLRIGQESAFRYDFVQSMRRQMEEEELCNRDRAEAILDLDAQVEKYRKNLDLSPQEAAAKYETATGEEKHLLWAHKMNGSGPMQLFLSLAPDELDSLRRGQPLKFSASPGEGERLLPSGIGERMLNYPESFRIALTDNSSQFGPPDYVPNGRPLSEFPGLTPTAHLSIQESEPGHFELVGGAGVKIPGRGENQMDMADNNTVIAHGLSPSIRDPQNAVANAAQKAAFQRDPALKTSVTIQPKGTCKIVGDLGEQDKDGPRLTSADALEALHKATGQNIVADYFTRVYEPQDVSVVDAPLFDALCRLADAMRLRWKREAGWLQFRSLGYFNENRMEVSNAELERWAASRRQHGALTLTDLTEIAQLTDTQLNSRGMSSGARAVFGLKEWPIARNLLRRDLRFFALLTPQQREAAATEQGVPFAQMGQAQQAAFCELCLGAFPTAEQVAGASVRVRYLPPAPKSEKEKSEQDKKETTVKPNPLAVSDADPDKVILLASAARIGTWKPENETILQFVYHYLGGLGARVNDNFGFSQEYEGKVFGD